MDRILPPLLCFLAALALVGLVIESSDDAFGGEGNRVQSRMKIGGTLEEKSAEDAHRHTFRHDPERVQLRARVRLKRGSVDLRLIDPTGATIWERRVSGRGHDRFTENFDGLAGEWRVEIEFSEAGGRYEVVLESLDR